MGFKFKKGSRVEVWNQLEKPLGSWCCAEIVSGNGRYYHVRYDRDPLDDQAVVKRVPRKAMRPCPPVKSRESWVPGDIVEVFDNSSWKLVEVCGVVGESYYLVRLRGSFSELTAHSSELRLQQCWQDDKWIVIDKDLVISGSGVINKISKEGKLSYQMLQPRPEVKKCNVGCHFPTKDGNDAKGLHWDLSRGINGKLHVSSPLAESYTEARKSRAIEGDGNRRRLISQHAPKLLEKVDAVASPQTLLGEKYTHASLNKRTTVFSVKDIAKEIPNAADEYYFVPSVEPMYTESTCSSVGSCSPYRSVHSINLGSHHDDAESSFVGGSEPSLPTKKALCAEIHRLELHAYQKTLVALHASGPMSWEQEELITNLRLMLHISNDEHLLELRNLVSVQTDIPFR